MSDRAAIVLAVLLGASGGALAAGDDNPLSRAVPRKEGTSACYSRTYDAAHLKVHPGQMTQSVMLSLRYEHQSHSVRIMLKEKNRPAPLYIVGGCGWSDKANLGVDDKPLIREFKATSGLDCNAFSGLNSDEEGGDYPIDFAEDGKSLTLYLINDVAAWLGTNQNKTIAAGLGKDDLIFRLERIDAAACRGMEKALKAK